MNGDQYTELDCHTRLPTYISQTNTPYLPAGQLKTTAQSVSTRQIVYRADSYKQKM